MTDRRASPPRVPGNGAGLRRDIEARDAALAALIERWRQEANKFFVLAWKRREDGYTGEADEFAAEARGYRALELEAVLKGGRAEKVCDQNQIELKRRIRKALEIGVIDKGCVKHFRVVHWEHCATSQGGECNCEPAFAAKAKTMDGSYVFSELTSDGYLCSSRSEALCRAFRFPR